MDLNTPKGFDLHTATELDSADEFSTGYMDFEFTNGFDLPFNSGKGVSSTSPPVLYLDEPWLFLCFFFKDLLAKGSIRSTNVPPDDILSTLCPTFSSDFYHLSTFLCVPPRLLLFDWAVSHLTNIFWVHLLVFKKIRSKNVRLFTWKNTHTYTRTHSHSQIKISFVYVHEG